MSLATQSIRRPVAVSMLFLAIVLLGAISFARLPIDLLPDIAYPRLVVQTTYPDVAPTEVERFVTEIVERQVSAVPGVERVESVSREGLSLVTLRFAWGTDMDFAVLNVREKLDAIREQLPELADRPAVLRTDPTSEPVMAISVSGVGDLWVLRELAEEVFKRRLEQIDGVAQAAVTGGLEREIHVEVDPRRLDSYGLGMQQIADALEAANQSAPGGTIRRGRYRYALRTIGEFQEIDEIGAVPLGIPSDTTGVEGVVRLRDVALVSDGFRDRESIARYNGREAVGLLVFKESGANTVRVAGQVAVVLDQLRVQYPDVRLDIATSQAGFITDAITSVVQALIFGGLLAFLVLFLFLRDWRYPVAIAVAIPISVVASFALLDVAGVSLNIMSLGGLALGVGMLVDNSIVVLENIFRHRERGVAADGAAGEGTNEVQGAIAASTLTTISVFGPIIYVKGVAGQLFGALSFAVAFALLASLVVALMLLPTMAARFRPRPGRADEPTRSRALAALDRRFAGMADWYHGRLQWALDHRGLVVGMAGVMLVAGVGLGATLERGVLPEVDQGAFTLRLMLDRGTPIEATAAAAARLETGMLKHPGVAAVFTRVGRQEAIAGLDEEESGINTAVLDVRVRDGISTDATLGDLADLFASFPTGVLTVEAGQATALGQLLGGAQADLAVRIRGDDLDAAFGYAREIGVRLGGLPALSNVRIAAEQGQPEVLIEVDRDRAAKYGIEPRRIARTVEQYMRGTVPTEFVEFNQKVPILIRLPDRDRRSLTTLNQLSVNGVPLRELVRTRETVGPAEVHRLEQSRTVTVFADVGDRGLDGALEAVRETIGAHPAPFGLRVDIGGENEERARSFRDLAFAFGLALILVYMILAAQFESFVHPFTILLAVPLSSVGAALALWLTGSGLNTMSLIGLVILVGIVVNDAIVKVDFINQMRGRMDLREAILTAGRVRLRPIIMTTMTTVLGLIPMALGWGRGSDLRAPLAIAVIGGLISATILTLIVIPVAYDLVEEGRARLLRQMGRLPGGHEARPDVPAPEVAP